MPAKTRRVLIYGVTGSGKSTLAERLAARLGLPYTSVDDLCWLPGWVQVSPEEQQRRIEEIVAGEAWLLDSAYGHWLPAILPRVELIVGLDYPRWVSLGRLLRRTARRVFTGETCCNGNRERLRLVFSRESIVLWHFRSFARKRARIRAWEAEGLPVLRFAHPAQVESWLASLPAGYPEGSSGG